MTIAASVFFDEEHRGGVVVHVRHMRYLRAMSVMIQIRNVPVRVHRLLRARAAREGMSLSEYLNREVAALVARPTLQDALQTIRTRVRPAASIDTVAAVRAERDARS